jgi:hypothetical protein
MDSGLLAELVIGPATTGRARWLGPGMTIYSIGRPVMTASALTRRSDTRPLTGSL